MRLNHDCVRHVMLTIEDKSKPGQDLYFKDLFIPELNAEDIKYATIKLIEAGYVEALMVTTLADVSPIIKSITWEGHEFVDNIRDDEVWKKTKNATDKVASVSIDILSNVASSILSKMF